MERDDGYGLVDVAMEKWRYFLTYQVQLDFFPSGKLYLFTKTIYRGHRR